MLCGWAQVGLQMVEIGCLAALYFWPILFIILGEKKRVQKKDVR